MRLRIPERLSAVDLLLWGLRVAIVVFVLVGSYATLSQGLLGPERWPGLLVNGLSTGAIYALIALGYTLVYGVLFMINFAHGEVFMSGVFTAYFAAVGLADSGILDSNPIVGLAIIFAVSMLTSMGVALLLERVAYRPLRRAPRLVPLITAIGASLFLQYTFRGLYGTGTKSYPTIDILTGTVTIFGIEMLKTQLVVIVAAVLMMGGLYVFVQRTSTGRAMRAVSEDKDVAAMMGINVDRVIATTFAIGGILAGATGILYVFLFNVVSFSMGFLPGIKAFTAAVLGGIGNIVGAMLGGVFLGLLESIGPRLLLSGFDVPSVNQLRDVVAFTVLVLVLIFRPYGILGRKE
ncbi:MAG TPA: branched-chain amino acid ABC transporter permease [Candidatus Limnocylindria bacterium]|nr:branched-chain amino acid ABC transporter permease [Candidatus Limnocylindria bacterium]